MKEGRRHTSQLYERTTDFLKLKERKKSNILALVSVMDVSKLKLLTATKNSRLDAC